VDACQWFRGGHIANARAAADGHLESIKNAIAARVTLLCGTDLPPADDVGGLPSTVVELMLLEEAGLSRLASLQTATVNPARLMGVEDQIGQVRPGFRADLIITDDNPLDGLAALGDVAMVLQEGRAVKGGL
jgi:imidazolonepropionase-like amidohydrolase